MDTQIVEISNGTFSSTKNPENEANASLHPGGSTLEDTSLTDAEGLTLLGKKALLVNHELDAMGMGRYQWTIFLLCGFGYMLDLLWAQAFSLVLAPLQNELGFGDSELGNLSTSFSAGLTAGAFVWGILVDIIGRRWAFNLTTLIASVFGLCLGAPSSYDAILILTAFVGFGVGGNIPIDTTITLEFLPQNRRFLLAALSIFQPIGVVVCSAIAYGFIPKYSCADGLKACADVVTGQACCTKASNYGWRYLLFTLGGITLLVFFLRFVVFDFQESPKFLLYQGKDEDAVKVLQHVAKYNKRPCSLTIESFSLLPDENSSSSSVASSVPLVKQSQAMPDATYLHQAIDFFSRYKPLFANATRSRLTILIWVIYMFDYWGFSIAGSFLPIILQRKNTAINVPLKRTYQNYIIIYTCGIPGVLLGTALYRGRYIALLISSTLMAASLFCFAAVDTEASNIGLNGMEYFFQSMFNAVLYGWTPEAYPAQVRGTASGVASFWGRVFSIVSPLIAARLLADEGSDSVLFLAGAGTLVCTVAIALLPRQYLGRMSL